MKILYFLETSSISSWGGRWQKHWVVNSFFIEKRRIPGFYPAYADLWLLNRGYRCMAKFTGVGPVSGHVALRHELLSQAGVIKAFRILW